MKIKKFNESTAPKIRQVLYIDLYDLREASNEEVENWINDNPHNSGFAKWWVVLDPNDAAYPKIEQYFLDNGLKVGDKVLVHSEW